MIEPRVINIQRFSIHDGPGIRTTVFFKGCPLNCAWCHNPESKRFERECMFYADRCVHCGRCGAVCPSADRCIGCGKCADVCAFDARQMVGERYSQEALLKLVERDRAFYDASGGGVTLSGGEPMAQDMDFILALLNGLKRRGIPVAIDTCGCAAYERYQSVLPFADVFLFDIKLVSPELHACFTCANNALILDNAARLSRDGARINIRVPVVPGVNAGRDEMARIIGFVKHNVNAYQVNLLPYHRHGQDKAGRLLSSADQPMCFDVPPQTLMDEIFAMWSEAGFADVRIGG